jgi:hypothetical protein
LTQKLEAPTIGLTTNGPDDVPFNDTSQEALKEKPSLFPPRNRLHEVGLTAKAEAVAEEHPFDTTTLMFPPKVVNKTEIVLVERVLTDETIVAPEGTVQTNEFAVLVRTFTE